MEPGPRSARAGGSTQGTRARSTRFETASKMPCMPADNLSKGGMNMDSSYPATMSKLHLLVYGEARDYPPVDTSRYLAEMERAFMDVPAFKSLFEKYKLEDLSTNLPRVCLVCVAPAEVAKRVQRHVRPARRSQQRHLARLGQGERGSCLQQEDMSRRGLRARSGRGARAGRERGRPSGRRAGCRRAEARPAHERSAHR